MLATLTIALATIGVVWVGVLAVVFLRDPARGLIVTDHHLEDLPKVMADRYLALVFFAAAAVLYGDFRIIAFVFAVFSFLGFADAYIYRKVGKPIAKHLSAGVLAALVALCALLTFNTGVSV